MVVQWLLYVQVFVRIEAELTFLHRYINRRLRAYHVLHLPLDPRPSRYACRRHRMAEMRRDPNYHGILQPICAQFTAISASHAPVHHAELHRYVFSIRWLGFRPVLIAPNRLFETDMHLVTSRGEEAHIFAPAQSQPQQRNTRQQAFSAQRADPMSEDVSSQDPESNNAPNINPFMSWEEMGLGQEEFGFLGRFDLPDLASWFSEIPDIP